MEELIASFLKRQFLIALLTRSAPNQFAQGLRTPLIFDDSLELSDPEESRFAGAYSDGLLAKSEAILSMSAFQKAPQSDLLSE